MGICARRGEKRKVKMRQKVFEDLYGRWTNLKEGGHVFFILQSLISI